MSEESKTGQFFKWLAGIAAALIVSGTSPFWWKHIVGNSPQPPSQSPPVGAGQGSREFRNTKGEVVGHRNADGSVTVLAPAPDPNAKRRPPAVTPDQHGMVPPPPKR